MKKLVLAKKYFEAIVKANILLMKNDSSVYYELLSDIYKVVGDQYYYWLYKYYASYVDLSSEEGGTL